VATRLPGLVSGTGGEVTAFTISGNQLQTAASFNYEAGKQLQRRIRSTDQELYAEVF
jgi:hypothetical protein